MAQKNITQIITKVLNDSNLSIQDLKKNGLNSDQIKSLSVEEIDAFNSIDINQVDRFLKDSDKRRENSLCNINHG